MSAMDGSEKDTAFALPADYRVGEVLSHRESRLVLRVARVDTGEARILKCLVPPFQNEDEEAFRREFLLLDALRHPCWVRPLRFGPLSGGGSFLEMEEAPGVTLSRWPIRGWWPETLSVAHKVLSGLEVLHRLGYAHLDLGPEQILVESTEGPTPWDAQVAEVSPRVRLLDLGLAAPFGAAIGVRGTPGSIAPELLQSRSGWDARVDLYAVGTILFELFTGQPAFPGRTVREVLARQLEGPGPDPGGEEGLPPPVRDLLRELLAGDPAARPRSALDTWQRLREQAPRADAGALPPFLMGGEEFAFIGRDAEIAAFDAWLSTLDPATAAGRYGLSGEEGIGCRRLAARLGAVAESRGWARSGDAVAPVLHHPRGGTVRIAVRSGDDAAVSLETRRTVPHGAARGFEWSRCRRMTWCGSWPLPRSSRTFCVGGSQPHASGVRVFWRDFSACSRGRSTSRRGTPVRIDSMRRWTGCPSRQPGSIGPGDFSAGSPPPKVRHSCAPAWPACPACRKVRHSAHRRCPPSSSRRPAAGC
jgi:hypothetical protein